MSEWGPSPKIPEQTKMANHLGTLMIVVPPIWVFIDSAFLVNQPETIIASFIYAALICIVGIAIRFRHSKIFNSVKRMIYG